MSVPKISIIIPVYNAEQYLMQCLDSILEQPFRDIEVICIDDGSTDGSLDILAGYQRKDPRIRVLTQENQYAGVARNHGMKHARGEYIHFMDADDWVLPEIYEDWYNIAKDQEADVCAAAYNIHDISTGKTTKKDNSPSKLHIYTCNFSQRPKELLYASVVPWNKIYRREFLEQEKIQFEELFCANDRSFYFRVITKAKAITFIKKAYINYNVNIPTSLTGTARLQHFDCHFRSFQTIWKIFEGYDNDIKSMVLDIGMKDIINFYNRSVETEYEKPIRKQIKEFLVNIDISVLTAPQSTYSWYQDYLLFSCYEEKNDEAFSLLQAEVRREKQRCQRYMDQKKKLDEQLKVAERSKKSLQRELTSQRQSLSFRLGRVVTFLPRKLRGFIGCVRDNTFSYAIALAWFYMVEFLSRYLPIPSVPKPRPWGLNKEKRTPKVIVSLTSYPGRIYIVHKTIRTLLHQQFKPDMVILWLANEQFPNKERDLPKELLKLKKSGLTIAWCNDTRPYKKLIPALKAYPDDIIVTADDDAYYAEDWLEKLYRSYETAEDTLIHCHRITRMYKVDGEWRHLTSSRLLYPCPSYLHKLVGLGGVLYPPHVFHKDILDEKKFMELAPTNDDVWFWLMAALNGVKVTAIPGANPYPRPVEGSQDNGSLCSVNERGDALFWKDFYRVLNAYPQLKELLDQEYETLHTVEHTLVDANSKSI